VSNGQDATVRQAYQVAEHVLELTWLSSNSDHGAAGKCAVQLNVDDRHQQGTNQATAAEQYAALPTTLGQVTLGCMLHPAMQAAMHALLCSGPSSQEIDVRDAVGLASSLNSCGPHN
jgi:hypothetical protein